MKGWCLNSWNGSVQCLLASLFRFRRVFPLRYWKGMLCVRETSEVSQRERQCSPVAITYRSQTYCTPTCRCYRRFSGTNHMLPLSCGENWLPWRFFSKRLFFVVFLNPENMASVLKGWRSCHFLVACIPFWCHIKVKGVWWAGFAAVKKTLTHINLLSEGIRGQVDCCLRSVLGWGRLER